MMNSLFNGLKAPLPLNIKERLFLELGNNGTILNVWSQEATHYPLMRQYLRPRQSIFEGFDFFGYHTLQEALKSGKEYFPVKPEVPSQYFFFDTVHTAVPLAHIQILESGAKRFLGMISFPRFLPDIHYAESNPLLYLDCHGLIRACTGTFAAFFRPQYPDPMDILGKPAALFIHPSPQELLRTRELNLLRNPRSGWKPVCRLKPGTVIPVNESDDVRYVLLPGTVDTGACDFRLSLRADAITGCAPILAIKCALPSMRTPNRRPDGYEASEQDPGWFQVKREGIAMETQEHPWGRPVAEYALEKRGRLLILTVNNQVVLTCHDPHFPGDGKSGVALGVRPGSGARILSCELEVLAVDQGFMQEPRPVVETLTAPPRHFYLTRFYNLALGSSYSRLAAYILMDVTPILEQRDRFHREYEKEKSERSALEKLVRWMAPSGEALIGESAAIRAVRQRAEQAADSPAPVLIEGPTGSGKEVLAHFIHDQSGRKKAPFVKVDCSALPASLIESELFGYEKGAFTGAAEQRIGRFEQADHGTLFLDEVANLGTAVQAKLLNVLQDHTITRLGGKEAVPLDIRIIAATNVAPEELMAGGLFREDLFYRINTVRLALPPLGERLEDLPLLCGHFIGQFNLSLGKAVKDLSPAAYRKLMAHSWPGNVRELKGVIQQAMIFSGGEVLEPSAVQFAPLSRANAVKRTSYHLENVTREHFVEGLKRHHGKITRVARELGVSTRACYYNFSLYGIDYKKYRP